MTVGEVRREGAGVVEEAPPRKRLEDAPLLGRDARDAFLKLLITQLKTQNPLEPMGNIEFVSHLAQLTSLEQMQNLNAKFDDFLTTTTLIISMSQVFPLLGRRVVTMDKDGNPISNIVSKIRFEKGKPLLTVGNVEVGLEDIKEISI